MKTLYLECRMGAAGDMLAAALLELHPEPEKIIEQLNDLGLPNVNFKLESATKCGISGKHFSVTVNGAEEESNDVHEHHHEHEHHHHHHHEAEHCHDHDHDIHHHEHHGLHDIEHIVMGHLNLPENVKQNVMKVYQIIAEAESEVHGIPTDKIHFHEVGSLDAIADISAVCLLMNELNPDKVIASPVHVGNGQVKCAHGILPVPAPATALILKDIPIYSGDVNGELCTPTGAALLKFFVSEFGSQPVMRVEKIGYGMGKKDFTQANCVRAMLGKTADQTDEILELCCNIDDMTAEEIGFAIERLFEAGAVDVYTTSIGMKKNRPGILLTCMCKNKCRDAILNTLFKHTATLGVRESVCNRYVLKRYITTENTEAGEIRIKHVSGYGTSREKVEYEDLANIAVKRNISLSEARKLVSQENK